jgi:PAS domain S-box-containing protein
MPHSIRNLRVLVGCVTVVAMIAMALAFHRLPADGNVGELLPLIERVICVGAAGSLTYLALWPTRSRLSQETQLLRAVTDGVTEVVFVKDIHGKYLYMNRAGVEALRKAPAEIIGHRNEELFPPDVARALDAACQPVSATGQPNRAEHDVPTAYGIRTFLSTKVPYRNGKGELIGVMGVAHDITDRKQMEAKLRRSHEQLTDVLESITDGMYTCDHEWRFTYINRRAKELLRLSDADLGQVIWQVRPEAVGSIFDQQFNRVMQERISVLFEAENDARHWEVHAYPTMDGLAVYFEDITERKEVEQALRQQERQLGEAQRIAHVGSWHWNLASNEIQWSDEHYRICGLPPQKSPVPFETAIACIHAEDREMVLRHCREAIERTGQYQCELRIVRPDGTQRFAHSRGEIVRDASGCPIEMFGTLQDITERKLAEDQLADSELRFRQLAENIREVFWMSDPRKSEILYVSPGYAETWGRSPEDLKTNPMAFTESVHPDDRAKVLEWVKSQWIAETEIEYRIIRPDGSMRWIRDRSFPVKDAAGNVIRNAGIAEDITARKNAEDATARLAAIVHSCEDAIISGTLDGIITSWNNAAERLYGFTAGEAIGKNVSMLIPAEGREEMRQALQRVTRGERLEQIELTRIRKDGSSIDVSISISPVHDSSGKIAGISKIARDITVRRRAEALERERAALTESIRAMDQVLGVVGHELRTPLTGLRAISEYLLDDQARQTEGWDRFLRNMHDEVIRMSKTVNDLLEAARLNSGRATWNFGTVELEQICEEALANVRPLIDESRVSLTSSICPQGLRMIGDADALRRLILNLVSNSHKYTEAGSIAVHVSARQSATERWVEIRVIDTGAGIPPEIAKRLGEPFALNSGTVGANYVSGTGLGISICKAIAAAHGGGIQFESKAGAGTTVTVALRADLNEPVRDSKATPQIVTCAA